MILNRPPPLCNVTSSFCSTTLTSSSGRLFVYSLNAGMEVHGGGGGTFRGRSVRLIHQLRQTLSRGWTR